jgi:uncharacterized protein (TIGR03067 family)
VGSGLFLYLDTPAEDLLMAWHSSLALLLGLALTAGRGPAADAPAKEGNDLKGTWNVVAGETGGERVSADRLRGSRVVITEDRIRVTEGGKTLEMTYKLDPKATPHHIDMTITEGPDKGKVGHGIYRFEGKRLEICYAAPGKERPTAFKTKSGSHERLWVLERAKSER